MTQADEQPFDERRKPRRRPYKSFVAELAWAIVFCISARWIFNFVFDHAEEFDRKEFPAPPQLNYSAEKAAEQAMSPMSSFNDPAHDEGNSLFAAEEARLLIGPNPTGEELLDLRIVEDCLRLMQTRRTQEEYAAIQERLRGVRFRLNQKGQR